jgi:hypothetical protein
MVSGQANLGLNGYRLAYQTLELKYTARRWEKPRRQLRKYQDVSR